MSARAKIWLIVGIVLVVSGAALFSVAMTANDWDFKKLSTTEYETCTHLITDDFHHLSIKTITADIRFVPSEDETCKVVCYEDTNVKHGAVVQEDTLTVHAEDKREWYDYIGVTVGTPTITVYLPREEYASLRIVSNTGDVELPKAFSFKDIKISGDTTDITCDAAASNLLTIATDTGDVTVHSVTTEGRMEFETDTGDIALTDVDCKRVEIESSTGDIALKNVVAVGNFYIQSNTGDVTFEHSDAAALFIETDTGDVRGSLLSDKVFITKTSTGRVDVPNTAIGGQCEITTDTGDIQLRIG